MNGKTDETAKELQQQGARRKGALIADGQPKQYLERLLRQRWILWAGILGAALLFVLSFWEGDEKADAVRADAAAAEASSAQEYERALEARLARLIGEVEGAGQVTVMVTLENTAQTVYAQAYAETSDTASDQQNGTSRRSSYSNDYILVEEGGSRQALTETTLQPTVKGVAVVCAGADDVRVVSRITELVSTVLGITSNRICVTK